MEDQDEIIFEKHILEWLLEYFSITDSVNIVNQVYNGQRLAQAMQNILNQRKYS